MTDFSPQSTDRVNDNTNPRLSNVLLEGSTSITHAVAGSGRRGTATVTFPLDTDYANCEVEAWVKTQLSGGANPVTWVKIPTAVVSSAGALSYAGWITVNEATKAGTYDITFGLFTTDSQLISTWPVHYRIITNKIAADGLSFT